MEPSLSVILIVEDDAMYAKKVIAPHFGDWPIQFAHTVPQSKVICTQIDALFLAIVDLDIPGGLQHRSQSGGAGFEVITILRQRFAEARIVILTGHLSSMLVNKAQQLGVEYVSKGNCGDNLQRIASDLRVAGTVQSNNRSIQIALAIANSSGLSKKQSEVLLMGVRSYSREEMLLSLDITEWTLRSHMREILKRTKAGRFQDLLRSIAKQAQSQSLPL